MTNELWKTEYPFQSHWFSYEGNKLHYIDEGPRDAKLTIIMAHGNPTWSFYYRHLVASLKKDYRVLVLDHLGMGLSDSPADEKLYHLEAHAKRFKAWVKSCSVKDFVLMVHDWGGPIGLSFALHDLEHLKGLILTNTAGFASPDIPKRIAFCKTPLLGKFIVENLNGFVLPAIFMASAKGLTATAKSGLLAPYQDRTRRKAVYRFVADIPMKETDQSFDLLKAIENSLTKIKAPVLILWGGKDFCFHQDFYRRFTEIFPAAKKHYFSEAGHYLCEDAKEEIGPLIENFVQGL